MEPPLPVLKMHRSVCPLAAVGHAEAAMDYKNKLLTPPQVARKLGVAKWTLQHWRMSGYGPPYVKIGRKIFYLEADVDKRVVDQRRRSTSDPGRPEE
jgi:hypothetical protein